MRERMKVLITIVTAVCIGLITGMVASAFNGLILWGTQWTRQGVNSYQLGLIVLPLIASILTIGLYSSKRISRDNGMGIAQVLFEMKKPDSQLMNPINVFWNSIASLVTLILGMTAGRFGPITHLGAAVGLNIGKRFKMNENELRLLMGCGAAGAIATVFNLPFFAAIFVMEVMFREQYFKVLAPLIISSVISNQVGIWILGNRMPLILEIGSQPVFNKMIVPMVVLGIASGLLSALYIASIEKATVFFQNFHKRKTALILSALIVGGTAYYLPLQFEIHYSTTNLILSGNIGIKILMTLIVLRILTTALTLGSGYVGGNFFPGVTIGSALGVLVWKVLSEIGMKLPSQGEMGILGIAAMVAGYMHAPLACTVLAIEVSKNMDIITSAMLVTATSVTISYIVYGRDIFTKAIGKLMIQSHHNKNEV